jgi:hypothetical protein
LHRLLLLLRVSLHRHRMPVVLRQYHPVLRRPTGAALTSPSLRCFRCLHLASRSLISDCCCGVRDGSS